MKVDDYMKKVELDSKTLLVSFVFALIIIVGIILLSVMLPLLNIMSGMI